MIEGKLYNLMPADIIPVEGGGTDATDPATARENLGITPENIGAAPKEHTHGYVDLKDVGEVAKEDIVPVAKGGTESNTAAGARAKLGVTRANLGISYGTATPTAVPATGAGAVYFKII